MAKGCCSHHGGISYCGNNGYYICEDGTQSPSCTCYGFEENDYYTFEEMTSDNYCNYTYYETKINEIENKNKELVEENTTIGNWLTILIFVIIIYFVYKMFKSGEKKT